jgi:hypothetical protein
MIAVVDIERARERNILAVLNMRGIRTKKISMDERAGPCPRAAGAIGFPSTRRNRFSIAGSAEQKATRSRSSSSLTIAPSRRRSRGCQEAT